MHRLSISANVNVRSSGRLLITAQTIESRSDVEQQLVPAAKVVRFSEEPDGSLETARFEGSTAHLEDALGLRVALAG